LRTEKPPIPHELLERLLDEEKLKHCFECGICTASCPVTMLTPNHYNPRILVEKIYHNPEQALQDPALWLCAWCYSCYRHCPQKVKLPEVLLSVRKIAKEKGHLDGWNQALEIISEQTAFPASISLVCLHPERTGINNPVETLSKHSQGKKRKQRTTPASEDLTNKIAVVGAGPAGLTAAYELAKKGYLVTVFEASAQLGGMLKQCIPNFRLPKDILDSEIEHIRNQGVEIRTNVRVGHDVTLDELWKQGYKAIFISVGAHKTRKLGIEGENLTGVFDALDFLQQANNNERINAGERVAVIGGGNVAVDSARTALRLGAKEVNIFYRRSRDEMPANPYEIREAEEEGIKIQFLTAPKRILGQKEHVTEIECLRMELGEPDQSGRRAPKPVQGSEFTIQVDSVILAIGEAPDLMFLPRQVEVSEGNTIAVEPFTAETSQLGVFAGGDCVSGPATLIEAIVAGKQAAECIDHYLKAQGHQKAQEILQEKK